MQKVRVPINSFQYGEVSDSLSMRVDTPIYASSASTIQNMVVMAEGSLIKRKGLKFHVNHGITYSSTYEEQSRLIPFLFDENEQYLVSIQHQAVKVYRVNTNGTVVNTNLNITAGIDGVNVPFDREYLQEYTTAQIGNVLYISHPLFAPRILTRTGLTAFEISTFIFDQRADNKKTYQPYARFQPQHTKLDPDDVSGSSVVLITHNNTEVADINGIRTSSTFTTGNMTLNGALISSGTATFSDARQITLKSTGNLSGMVVTATGTDQDGTSISESLTGPNNSTVTYTKFFKTIATIVPQTSSSSVAIEIGVTDRQCVSYFDITGSINAGYYGSSTHVGTTIRYAGNEILITNVARSDSALGTILDSLQTRLDILNPFRTNNGSAIVEVSQPVHGFAGGESLTVADATAVGGIAASNLNGARTVTSVIDENTFTFTAAANSNSSADGGGFVKITSHAPTLNFDEQSFSAKRGYPAAVAIHQNRLVFGGTLSEPDALWFSQIGRFYNYDIGEALDNEAISVTAATGAVNNIRYLVSNRDLQIFTSGSEFYVPTFENKAITPTNLQIKKQTPFGTSFVTPVEIDGATLFVQANGKAVREYIYTDSEQAYSASPVSSIASHMINSPKYMAVAHSGFGQPDSYAAMTNSDGTMALFSSNRTERRASWTKITIEGGKFNSLAAIGDRLFANVYDKFNSLMLCEFTGDVGLDVYQYTTISQNKANVGTPYDAGDVVDVIMTDVLSSFQDYMGEFTVNSDQEVDLTGLVENQRTHAYVGKRFNAKIVTNEIDASMGNGPVTGDVRGIGRIILDLKNTQSIKVNSKNVSIGSKLNPNNSNFTVLNPITGKIEVKTTGFSRSPRVTIEQNEPLPLQVNGLVVELIV